MKTFSALVFSTMMPASQASLNEHGALLQLVSGHKLTSAGSALDKTKELQQYIDSIAKENRGKKLQKDIKTYLKEIKAQLESMDKQLSTDHDAAQKVITDAFNVLNTCNTAADTASVTAALEAAAKAQSDHASCRKEETVAQGQAIGSSGACTTFYRSLSGAMKCSNPALSGTVAEHERMMGIFDDTAALDSAKKNCNDKLAAYTTKNGQCQTGQATAEQKTCQGHLKSHTVCGELDSCHAKAKVQYETDCTDMVVPRDTRKAQALVSKSLICKIEELLKDNTKVDDLAGCEVKANDDVTKPLDIQCAAVPAKKACEWPKEYTVAPGVDKWFTDNYAGEDWFSVATNDVQTQVRIPAVKHECDLPERGPYSKPPPSTSTGKGCPVIHFNDYTGCEVDEDGKMNCWGEVDQHTKEAHNIQYPVKGTSKQDFEGVVALTGDYNSMCALLKDKTVTCFGWCGKHGGGTSGLCDVPKDLPPVREVHAGSMHVCALLEDSYVRCWGRDDSGCVKDVPKDVKALDVATAAYATCIVDTDSKVRCWGQAAQIGNLPKDLGAVKSLSGAGQFFCAVTTDGSVKCWGRVYSDSPQWSRYLEVPTDLGKASSVEAGYSHACAMLEDGSTRCWGVDIDCKHCLEMPKKGAFPSSSLAVFPRYNCVQADDYECWGTSWAYKSGGENVETSLESPRKFDAPLLTQQQCQARGLVR